MARASAARAPSGKARWQQPSAERVGADRRQHRRGGPRARGEQPAGHGRGDRDRERGAERAAGAGRPDQAEGAEPAEGVLVRKEAAHHGGVAVGGRGRRRVRARRRRASRRRPRGTAAPRRAPGCADRARPAAAARPAAIVQKTRVRTPAVRSIDQKATTAAPQSTKGTKGPSVRIEACGPRRTGAGGCRRWRRARAPCGRRRRRRGSTRRRPRGPGSTRPGRTRRGRPSSMPAQSRAAGWRGAARFIGGTGAAPARACRPARPARRRTPPPRRASPAARPPAASSSAATSTPAKVTAVRSAWRPRAVSASAGGYWRATNGQARPSAAAIPAVAGEGGAEEERHERREHGDGGGREQSGRRHGPRGADRVRSARPAGPASAARKNRG